MTTNTSTQSTSSPTATQLARMSRSLSRPPKSRVCALQGRAWGSVDFIFSQQGDHGGMGTWVVRIPGDADGNENGPRLAVKDCIDMAGLPTTAGCPVVAEMAERAHTDAPVVAAARGVVERVRGGGRHRRGGRGARHGYRRFRPRPRGLLRRGRPEDHAWPRLGEGRVPARPVVRHRGADWRGRRRRRAGDAAARTRVPGAGLAGSA